MKLLLLAGSGEARVIAQSLSEMPKVEVLASLAGVTRDPRPLAAPVRSGRFGGKSNQIKFIQSNGFDAVVDATHPFAAKISERTAAICRDLNLPFLHVRRPEWQSEAGDNWTEIDSAKDAATHIPQGATVFIGSGRGTLDGFANLTGRYLICRQIDHPNEPFPYPNGEYLVGRPPFSVDDEIALFRKLRVDVLVVKNAGGIPSRTKLDAARVLGIPVLLIKRPALPDATLVETPEAAIDWVKALMETTKC